MAGSVGSGTENRADELGPGSAGSWLRSEMHSGRGPPALPTARLCTPCSPRPNVRGNAGPTGWRQAREAEDVPHGFAGLVPSRWASR